MGTGDQHGGDDYGQKLVVRDLRTGRLTFDTRSAIARTRIERAVL